MGEVVHEQPEDGAEVVLRPGHRHLDGNWRLRVAVAAGTEESFALSGGECGGGRGGGPTYNLCMRETMVLKAAWMSAVVQVQTTGRWWFWSTSERY